VWKQLTLIDVYEKLRLSAWRAMQRDSQQPQQQQQQQQLCITVHARRDLVSAVCDRNRRVQPPKRSHILIMINAHMCASSAHHGQGESAEAGTSGGVELST